MALITSRWPLSSPKSRNLPSRCVSAKMLPSSVWTNSSLGTRKTTGMRNSARSMRTPGRRWLRKQRMASRSGISGIVPAGVGAQHPEEVGLLPHGGQRLGHGGVGAVAVHVHQEDVDPQLLSGRPRLDLGEVNGAVRELVEDAHQ